MKTPLPSKISDSIFNQDTSEHPVRMIKAAQAGKLLNASGNGHNHLQAPGEAHKKPEIRMIHSGADYCDLELVCGCGESTQVRCWNTPPANEKGAL